MLAGCIQLQFIIRSRHISSTERRDRHESSVHIVLGLHPHTKGLQRVARADGMPCRPLQPLAEPAIKFRSLACWWRFSLRGEPYR